MASPREIVRRWDARLKREAALARARKAFANDNDPPEPAGAIMVDGQPMTYWLPPGVELYGAKTKSRGIA